MTQLALRIWIQVLVEPDEPNANPGRERNDKRQTYQSGGCGVRRNDGENHDAGKRDSRKDAGAEKPPRLAGDRIGSGHRGMISSARMSRQHLRRRSARRARVGRERAADTAAGTGLWMAGFGRESRQRRPIRSAAGHSVGESFTWLRTKRVCRPARISSATCRGSRSSVSIAWPCGMLCCSN
jgi:hypothetical protein